MEFRFIILILLAFGISYLIIPALVRLSEKSNIVDNTGKIKRHKHGIPMLGGIPIFLTLLLTSILFVSKANFLSQGYVLLSFSILFFTGLYDDIRPLTAGKKFLFQVISAIILVYLADAHPSSYFTKLAISEELIKVISVVFIVFIINAYNLVDGINGLSALLSMLAILSFGSWFLFAGFNSNGIICFALAASICAFLRFNLFNTRIFLGDNGSMLLGLIVAYFAIVFIQYNQELPAGYQFKLIAPFGLAAGAMAIPGMDTIRLFVMRSLFLQKSPFKGDRNHLHHLLLRLDFSHIQVSFILTAIGLLLLFFAIFAQAIGNTGIIFIIILVYITMLIALDYFISNLYRKRIPKKTIFNEVVKIKSDLDNPVILEFFFALSFFILAVAIPFHRVSASIPTLLVGFFFLALLIRNFARYHNKFVPIFKANTLRFIKHPYSILVGLFITLYSLHYAFYPAGRINGLTLKILLLVYWLPFFELQKVINIKPDYLLRAYIYGCFGFSIFILYHALFSFNELGWDAFFYINLLDYVKANPITHSLYYNLAIIFTVTQFKTIKRTLWKVIYLIIGATFIAMVFLISSKMGFLALLINILGAIFLTIKGTVRRIAVISVLTIVTVLGYQLIPNLGNRIDGFIWRINPNNEMSMDNRLPRPIIWKESVGLIKENWLTGIGVGNSMNVLGERYKAINYEKGAKYRFNCHNQFMESFLQTGFFGFLILCIIFIYSVRVAFRQKNIMYLLFLSNILLYMMIESLFETQMGTVAFAFFNALFLSSFINNRTENEPAA